MESRLRLWTKSWISEAREETAKPIQPAQPQNMIKSNLVGLEKREDKNEERKKVKKGWFSGGEEEDGEFLLCSEEV